MAIIGTIAEIWRYPFKSMAGERLNECRVTDKGIPGDRGWAVRDERAQEIRGAKKIPGLLQCSARYVEEPSEERIPEVEITLPDGTCFRSGAAHAASALSRFLGRSVSLWPLQPASQLDHYRRGVPDHPDLLTEVREILGRLPDEPIPDLSMFPPDLLPFAAPPGSYFDLFPLHLLTTASMRTLAARAPGTTVDVRRFRPNFLIEASGGHDELPERDWGGRTLRIGPVEVKIEMPTVRCVMPTLPQGDLAKEPAILRTIVRDLDQNLGVYATVVTPGAVRVGDAVALV
jgi:uncharacterized protein YcbX